MHNPRILESSETVLLIVDVQESYRKVLKELDTLTRNITILAEAAKILKLPVFLSEQYPQGLGKTIAEIAACLGDHRYFSKTSFSCCRAEGFLEELEGTGRKQVLICGIETHVCVSQTVHQLMALGYAVHVAKDAIASRYERHRDVGWEKMMSSGAVPTCVEGALFEMLGESGTELFKSVQRLVK
jgi:nicotinamidase-related amidase